MISGEGLLEEIYSLLWMNLDEGNDIKYSFSLPNVVLFSDSRPKVWYLTNKHGKVIKRKDNSISFENLVEAFTSNNQKSQISC